MITTDKLKKLGFNGFDFLRKEQRDSFERMALITLIENRQFTVRVILKNNSWCIDFIQLDGDINGEVLSKYLHPDYSLEDVVNVIKRMEYNAILLNKQFRSY